MSFQITEHKILDDQLLSAWQQLWDASSFAHFFNSPQWFLACQKVYPAKSYRVISLADNGEYLAFLPVYEERRFGVKTLAFPGGKHLDKSAWLLKSCDQGIVFTLVNYLALKGNFFLQEIDAKTASGLNSGQNRFVTSKASVNPYIPLDNDPFSFLTKKQHNKIFNKIKNHCEHLRYECHKGSQEALNIAFAIDWNSSKKMEGKPTFVTEEDRQFFRQLIHYFKEQVVIDILFYDNVPFVFSIGFVYKQAFLAHTSAYDFCYHNISPRKLLLYYTLPRLKAEGITLFDFSRGTSSLKQEFTPLFKEQFNVYFTQSIFVNRWWHMTNTLREKLVESKWVYQTYLFLKKMLIMIKDRLRPPRGFETKTVCLGTLNRIKSR